MNDNLNSNENKQDDVVIENNSIEQNVDLTKKNGKKKKGILVCIIIVLLLAVVGVGGYFGYTKIFKQKKTTNVKSKVKKSQYRLSGNGLEDFDLRFLQLENEQKNKVYSPLSIKYALAMLQEGAKGETKEQITNLIGDYKAKKYPNNEHMSFANAMFIRNTFKDKVREEYTNNIKEKYNAEVILDDFSSPDNINNWVSDKTFNLINNLLERVDQNTFFLINALAIDMNWNNQIHCEGNHAIPCVNNGTYSISYLHEKLEEDSEIHYSVVEYPYTEEDDFYGGYNRKNEFNGKENTKGATVLADFNKYDIVKELGEDKIKEILRPEYEEWLKTPEGANDLPVEEGLNKFIKELKENYGKKANSTDFFVHEDDNVKVFAKDLKEYDGMTLQYVGIMPKSVELTEFIKNINKDEVNKIIKELKEVNIDNFEDGYVTRIRGFIPFFKYEYQLKLEDDLKALDIKNIFDINKSDLSGMVNGEKNAINPAIHKATIEFSNDGIKASASTAMGGYGAATGPYFEHLFKVPVKEIDVSFNKPYMYIIRDKATGEVWFAGTVYEPIVK